ncbi:MULTISPECIES: helix-turn-helix domain-containing protein [unclassified Variovorax]|jgi:AraC-like DNA-binding protein|uniref:helix-turn-helix domain-containing protein n=1 Tax=unclassified Variovorax TaxID=663243 RepID=UPI000F7D7F25|nr:MULTISPECIES: helix-turn-helix domain-containing protein [unclassified Variovorax]RSZ39503.1 AraC family transcriptional regulator [Variovorax sp. 553]RSZ40793.1 AraC family transcriptional regulator [Variovorax sp. 679]
MQLTRLPSPRLRPFVRLMWASAPTDKPIERPGAREHVLPTGGMHLVFRLGGPPLRLFRNDADAEGFTVGHIMVGGTRSAFFVRDVSVETASVGAMLQPGAARALLGALEGALADCHTPLDALWGADAGFALEQLQNAGSLTRQLAILDALLCARMEARAMHGLHPAVAQALASLYSAGDGRQAGAIGELVKQSGYSHRRFIELFRDMTGIAPKQYARMLRFDRVLGEFALDATRPWVELALEAGYSDQAHFNREFLAIAGMSPQAYRRAAPVSSRHVRV